MLNASKTIAAISTAAGAGGIGVIRISGPLALKIGKKISGGELLAPRIANFKSFKDLNGSLIDQGLILYFSLLLIPLLVRILLNCNVMAVELLRNLS